MTRALWDGNAQMELNYVQMELNYVQMEVDGIYPTKAISVGFEDKDNPREILVVMKCCSEMCSAPKVFAIEDPGLAEDVAASLLVLAQAMRAARGEVREVN